MLVIHSHFHSRRTGVTSHTEAIVSALAPLCEARVLGWGVSANVKKIGLQSLWRRSSREYVIWHAHRNLELLFGFVLRALGRKLRLVFTRHSASKPSRYSRWLMAGADVLITLNDEIAQMLGPSVEVVPHGIDLSRFVPPTMSRKTAMHGLGLNGELAIGVVGRIRPDKGQGDFVDAMRPILSVHQNLTAVLVGLVKSDVVQWANSLAQRAPRVVFAGEQNNVLPWIHALSIVVQPSHAESFSLAIVEAMACGSVVIATNLPAAKKLIDHGRTGFLYEPGDIEALRSIVTQLVEHPSNIESVGQAAAAKARECFGIDREAKRLELIYLQCFPSNRGASL